MKHLAVEHHTVSLRWGKQMESRVWGLATGERRYLSMLQYCQKMNIGTLMTAHHLDDAIGE